MERLNLRNLSELQVSEQNQIKFSKSFAILDNLNDSEDIKYGLGKHYRGYRNLS
jgi:hypothetical protein